MTCACGCNQEVTEGCRFRNGHNQHPFEQRSRNEIIRKRIREGARYCEVARELNMTRQRVYQIANRKRKRDAA